MRLNRLLLENFMPYRGVHEIELPVADGRGIVVVYGDNMRGKTSFLNALRWAFFGRATARQMRQVPTLNLINADAADEGEWRAAVQVDFEASGSTYQLKRSVEPRSHVAHPRVDQDFIGTLSLKKDGTHLDVEALQTELDQILPEQVSRFFLFDGELLQEYESLVRDVNQGARIKMAVERILGVPALINGRDETHALLAQAQALQAQELRHSKSLRSQAEQQLRLQAEMEKLQAKLREQTDRLKAAEAEIEEIDAELERLASQRQAFKDHEAVRARESSLLERLRSLGERRALMLQDAWIELLAPRVSAVVARLDAEQREFFALLRQQAELEKHVALLKQAHDEKTCPICRQSLSAGSQQRVATSLGASEASLETSQLDFENAEVTAAHLNALRGIRSRGDSEQIAEVERQAQSTQIELARVSFEKKELEADLADGADLEIARLLARRGTLQGSLGAIVNEVASSQVLLDENASKQAQIARLLARNPDARKQRSSALVEKYGGLERIFAASVDKLRDIQRGRVGEFASYAFERLTTESGFKKLAINENYGLTIIDDKDREVPERSAGAEQIVALALIDGLNKAARRLDPIVMDTPFGRLDNRHRHNVLRYLPQMAEQVILLVHEGELDPNRDLLILWPHVAATYKIERISTRQSRIVRDGEFHDFNS